MSRRGQYYTDLWDEYLLFGGGFYRFMWPPHRDPHREPRLWAKPIAAWEARREEILEGWIVEHPNTRPFAFWAFEAPQYGPRRHVGGDGSVAPSVAERRYIIASPPTPNCERVLIGEDEDAPVWETEFEWLSRHGLLCGSERVKC